MSLTVTIELPKNLEQELRTQSTDLNAEVTEAFAMELFRRGRLSHFELSQVLGLDRFEMDAYLKRHNVFEGSLTMEDLEEQPRTLERVMGPVLRRSVAECQLVAWDAFVAGTTRWTTNDVPTEHVADDSRESIYQGRGE